MKKLSIILSFILVAMVSCTKSKEVHPEIGDGNDEIVTVGMKDVHVEYTRTDHAELNRVVFHYCPADANGNAQQFEAAEMTKKETFFELVLDDLICDTLYWYYYELFPNSGDAFTIAQKTFHTQACDTPEPPTPIVAEYVDLCLPSGTLWATCNVGANSPEEYGCHFAWGETQPKTVYNWDTYLYCNGSENTLTKYCTNSSYGYLGFTDNLTLLEANDDAATANWGTDWRTPTKEEWKELLENTTHIWTTQGGVNGWLFSASCGNSIFLPASGTSWIDGHGEVGDYGYYCSSSLSIDHPNFAWTLYFGSNDCGTYESYRGAGESVRPVRSIANYSLGAENVINGGFEQGNVGFTSEYEYDEGILLYEGLYNVDYDASLHHPDFIGAGHGGTGYFMIINGAMESEIKVWTEQISVMPNTCYVFSTWVCTLVEESEAMLQFSINGAQIGNIFMAPEEVNTWQQFYVSWYSGNSTTATITILNQNTVSMGNDFGLDDISFRELILNP
jgi:hypothetical protein